MFTKLPNGEIIYEEDIECVVDGINGIGAIYIGNLEASQNPNTLKSNHQSMYQNTTSNQSSHRLKVSS